MRAAIAEVVQGLLDLRLSPIEEADLADSVLSNPIVALPVVPPPTPPHPAETLLANFPIPFAAHELDIKNRRMILSVVAQTIGLAACREIESELRARFKDWSIRVARRRRVCRRFPSLREVPCSAFRQPKRLI